jgi:hypothetical protein
MSLVAMGAEMPSARAAGAKPLWSTTAMNAEIVSNRSIGLLRQLQ